MPRFHPQQFMLTAPLRALAIFGMLALAGCGQGRAPEFLIFGSYFPAWLVGAAISIPVTALIRWGLIRTGIDDALPLRLFVYVCIGLLLTMTFAFIFSPR